MVLYLLLAMVMGAKGNYKKQEEDELEVEKALKNLVDEDAEKELEEERKQGKSQPSAILTAIQVCSYVFLVALVIISVLRYLDAMPS